MNTNKFVCLVLVTLLFSLVGFGCGSQCNGFHGANPWGGVQQYGGGHYGPNAGMYSGQGTPVVVYGPQPGPRPVVAGPGGNIAALDSPIAGCDAPFRVDVKNETDKFLSLMVDGNPLPINGAGTMPYLPPRTRLYICLAQPGSHMLQGVAYVNRLGQFAEVSRFQKRIVGISRGIGTDHNVYRIQEHHLTYMER